MISTVDRVSALCRLTAERLRSLSPQRRDSILQSALAQSLGRSGRIRAALKLTDSLVRLKRAGTQTAGLETPMMDDVLLGTLQDVTEALEAEGITYAITGSVASSVHGEPVASLDVDLIVRMKPAQATGFAQRLPQHFYRSSEALVDAARDSGLANLIDLRSSLKIDLSVVAGTSFFDGVFRRSTKIEFARGVDGYFVVSPEDIILMKLEWRRESKSGKQWENALGVARAIGNRLDWSYLNEWASKLKVTDQLAALRVEAGLE